MNGGMSVTPSDQIPPPTATRARRGAGIQRAARRDAPARAREIRLGRVELNPAVVDGFVPQRVGVVGVAARAFEQPVDERQRQREIVQPGIRRTAGEVAHGHFTRPRLAHCWRNVRHSRVSAGVLPLRSKPSIDSAFSVRRGVANLRAG